MQNTIEVFTNCYHQFGLIGAFSGIEALGVHDIEIGIHTHPGILDLPTRLEDLDRWDASQVGRLKGLLGKYGLSAQAGFVFVENTDTEAFRLDQLKFDVASQLGIKVVNLSVTWQKPLEEAYKIFPQVLEYCSQYDFELALELHPPLFDNAEVFWKVANDFPGFPLKANFDTANVYYYNNHPDGPAELEKVAERLAHMHIKDSFCEPQDPRFPALGEGTIPFKDYFTAMEKCGFDGPCSLEIEGADEEQNSFAGKHAVMERSVAFMRNSGFEL